MAARSAPTSPLAQAATNIAARPTLNTASARHRVGQRAREWSVDVVVEFGHPHHDHRVERQRHLDHAASAATTTPP